MSATRIPARRSVAVLLLSLVAFFALVAGPATEAAPRAAFSNDVALVAAGPQSALLGRLLPAGHPGEGATPAGHPGPVLDTLLLAPPDAPDTGPASTAVDRSATAGLDPGHGSPADLRGPPTA